MADPPQLSNFAITILLDVAQKPGGVALVPDNLNNRIACADLEDEELVECFQNRIEESIQVSTTRDGDRVAQTELRRREGGALEDEGVNLDAVMSALEELLLQEDAFDKAINTAEDTGYPCGDVLRDLAAAALGKLKAYQSFSNEDLHASYGYLVAQIENLNLVAHRAEVAPEVQEAINKLLAEIHGPWWDRLTARS